MTRSLRWLRGQSVPGPRAFAQVADKGIFLALFALGVAALALAGFVSESFGTGL